MSWQNDTIAAIATGLTPAGIGIIRISGPESYEIADRIFTGKTGNPCDLTKPNRIHYGFINVSRETLDEVLVMNMKAPHSYTGEDTIEINCHGGPTVMKKVFEAVLANGARAAEPGEFTKRAFLNGRIDLSQAEAVIDLINAKNTKALLASTSQLKGSVSEEVKKLRDLILQKTAYIEAALDDPEHYELNQYGAELQPELENACKRIRHLAESYRNGRLVKEGISTCILGKPNAGKSSLLNALLGEERAIVTDIPGTTRDVICESFTAGGLTFNLMDTAGIRDSSDPVEMIGVTKALEQAETADLILYVIDASAEPDGSDGRIFSWLKEKEKPAVFLLNKKDLTDENRIESLSKVLRDRFRKDDGNCPEILPLNAASGDGTEDLLKILSMKFGEGKIGFNDELLITSERQKNCLVQAAEALERALGTISAGLPEDFLTVDLMDAYHQLGLIIGEETEDDLCDRIFSEFCMGK